MHIRDHAFVVVFPTDLAVSNPITLVAPTEIEVPGGRFQGKGGVVFTMVAVAPFWKASQM